MVKEFISFAKQQLIKDEITFRQQTSGEDINPQTKVIEGRREPKEYDAEPDKFAAIEQKDMEDKIRALDDKDNNKNSQDPDTGSAGETAPAGLAVQLGWGSGSYTTDSLQTGGEKDEERGEIEELEEETKEREFVK